MTYKKSFEGENVHRFHHCDHNDYIISEKEYMQEQYEVDTAAHSLLFHLFYLKTFLIHSSYGSR